MPRLVHFFVYAMDGQWGGYTGFVLGLLEEFKFGCAPKKENSLVNQLHGIRLLVKKRILQVRYYNYPAPLAPT